MPLTRFVSALPPPRAPSSWYCSAASLLTSLQMLGWRGRGVSLCCCHCYQ